MIQAVRRLYNPKGKKLPLPMTVELNRRLAKGYTRYKDDPRVVNLKRAVLAYNKKLFMLNIRDHQVEYAKFSIPKVVLTLVYRLGKLLLLSAGVLPGLVLFAPVFIAGKVISVKKSREALAASTVKIQGRDVIATWKLLVSMALAPALYTFYTVLLTWWTYHNRVQGCMPAWVPLLAVVAFGYVFFPTITYAALRFGETAMDITKSLRPLVLSLNPSSGNTLVKLRQERAALAAEVTDLINTLGPEMFPDFDAARIVADPFRDGAPGTSPASPGRAHFQHEDEKHSLDPVPSSPARGNADASTGGGPSAQGQLPRNESFRNLSGVGFFATRPGTPSRSRSRTNSGGLAVHGLSALDSRAGFDEVSKKIRGAMRERSRRRKSEGRDGWEPASGVSTPGSEEGARRDV